MFYLFFVSSLPPFQSEHNSEGQRPEARARDEGVCGGHEPEGHHEEPERVPGEHGAAGADGLLRGRRPRADPQRIRHQGGHEVHALQKMKNDIYFRFSNKRKRSISGFQLCSA